MRLIAELKRRNVLRAGALYAAGAWLLVQVATQVFPFFNISNWVVRWIVIAAVIGFPFALIFSWFYELTPQGLRLESEITPGESITAHTGKKLDRWIIAILTLVVVLLLTNQFVLHKDTNAVADKPVAATLPAKSIAVLPLINESGDPKQDYFSDGLSEELISALAQVHDLKVIGRNSSFQFRGKQQADNAAIGQKLGVATLLEGTVRMQGNQVRIVASLIKADDGSQVWSQSYDHELKDIFAVQSEIATAVAGALKAVLLGEVALASDKPPSGSIDAYTALLQGNFYLDRHGEDDYHKSIAFYDEAISVDPRYALAYANLALAWVNLGATYLGGAETAEANVKARAAASTALSLDPDLAVAHVARGNVLMDADFDYAAAEAEFRRAVALAPADATVKNGLATLLSTLGHLNEAADLTRQALAIDPLHISWLTNLASNLIPLGRLDEAEQVLRTAIALQPSGPISHMELAIVAILRGQPDVALQAAQQENDGTWRRYALALALQAQGDHAAAEAALQALIAQDGSSAPFQIASVYAYRQQPEQVFAWLDRTWTARDPGVAGLLYDPFLLAYKNDPRFAAFCRKVGLPVPGESTDANSTAPVSADRNTPAAATESERKP